MKRMEKDWRLRARSLVKTEINQEAKILIAFEKRYSKKK